MPAGTSRIVAAGTRLFAQGGGEGTFTQVAGVVSLGGPDQSADQIDVTELDPYEGLTTLPAAPEFFKLFTAGWRDSGSFTMLCNFTEAGRVRIQGWFDAGITASFYVLLRNGYKQPFSAFVTGLAQTMEKEGLVQYNVTFKITGKVGITTAGV